MAMVNFEKVKRAFDLIKRAQADLGYELSEGERVDLCVDNFDDWSLDEAVEAVRAAKYMLNIR